MTSTDQVVPNSKAGVGRVEAKAQAVSRSVAAGNRGLGRGNWPLLLDGDHRPGRGGDNLARRLRPCGGRRRIGPRGSDGRRWGLGEAVRGGRPGRRRGGRHLHIRPTPPGVYDHSVLHHSAEAPGAAHRARRRPQGGHMLLLRRWRLRHAKPQGRRGWQGRRTGTNDSGRRVWPHRPRLNHGPLDVGRLVWRGLDDWTRWKDWPRWSGLRNGSLGIGGLSRRNKRPLRRRGLNGARTNHGPVVDG